MGGVSCVEVRVFKRFRLLFNVKYGFSFENQALC